MSLEGFCKYCLTPRSEHLDDERCLFIPNSVYIGARCTKCKCWLSQPPDYYRGLSDPEKFPRCSTCGNQGR